MKKYTEWNKNLLKNQFMYSQLNSEFIEDYYRLKLILAKEIIIFPKTKIEEEIQAAIAFEDFAEDIRIFEKLKNLLCDEKNLSLDEFNISLSTILSFTHDFYSSLENKEFSKMFQKVFKHRNDNLMFSNERSMEVYLPNHKYAYIRTAKDDTIQDFTNIIHEYGHAVADLINDHFNILEYPLIELPSIFFTLISLDKLNKNFEDLEEEIRKFKIQEIKTILNYSKHIRIFNDYCQKNNVKSMHKLKKALKYVYGIRANEIKYIMSTTNIERYTYVIPYLIAIELYKQYQKDPELALHKLKELILINESDNYIVDLQDMGINLNENSEEYVRSLKR